MSAKLHLGNTSNTTPLARCAPFYFTGEGLGDRLTIKRLPASDATFRRLRIPLPKSGFLVRIAHLEIAFCVESLKDVSIQLDLTKNGVIFAGRRKLSRWEGRSWYAPGA